MPLTTRSVSISAEVYANWRFKGTPIDDIDILIAGVALENNLILVTNNRKDFDKVEGLEVEDWNEE